MMQIAAARPIDAAALTEIAFTAKRHWRYPESWIRRWRDVLTITPEYIVAHPTFVAVVDDKVVGFATLQITGDEALLDHLWVLTPFMGQGVGRALFEHAETIARTRGVTRMNIVGDPHAESFYLHLGATLYGRESASMDGEDRSLPLLVKML